MRPPLFLNPLSVPLATSFLCLFHHRVCPPSSERIFMYACTFFNQKLKLPFIAFQTWVLSHVDITPLQLHSNTWAFSQAYTSFFKHIDISPLDLLFFFIFDVSFLSEGFKKNELYHRPKDVWMWRIDSSLDCSSLEGLHIFVFQRPSGNRRWVRARHSGAELRKSKEK